MKRFKTRNYVAYGLGAVLIIYAFIHWMMRERHLAASVSSNASISYIEDNKVLTDFVTALKNGDKETISRIIQTLPSPFFDRQNEGFEQAFVSGELINVWAISGIDESSGVAIDGNSGVAMNVLVNFNLEHSKSRQGNALFFFKRKNSTWVLDWYHPGATVYGKVIRHN